MRIGIGTPVVIRVPGRSAAWEDSAGIDEIAQVAEAGDRLGYQFLTCSDHVGVPPGGRSARLPDGRGTRYWDPLATLSFLAARTERIRLLTNVLVLGYHHPLAIAKRYGTLDQISGGRVRLGVGVGTMEEEFRILGAPFEGRGARADDALRALRVALSQKQPEYHGEFYDFEGLVIEPHALQDRVPLWVGGHSPRSLRRAVTLADGWIPAGLDNDLLRSMLAKHPDRSPDFEVVSGPTEDLNPIDEPQRAEDTLGALAEAGVTTAVARFVHTSLAHYLEQLEALTALDCFTPLALP